MNADQETLPPEGLTEVVSLRITDTEKRAVRLIASADVDGLTESEVLRRFFDWEGLRAAAAEIRAKLVA